MHEPTHDVSNYLAQTASLGAIVLSFAGVLPAIAAIIAATWYLIQIYESETVQRWMRNRRHRKIARLQAQLIKATAENEALRSTHDA